MAINLSNHKAIDTYYAALATYRSQDVTHEQATRCRERHKSAQ